MSELEWALPFLVCPRCRGRLDWAPEAKGDGYLVHRGNLCDERYPVIDGIPRLLLGPSRARLVAARREWFAADLERRALAARWRAGGDLADEVVSGFDYEWRHFATVGTAELGTLASQYFDLVPAPLLAADRVVIDAGCGAGRWAYEVANRGPRVIAVDLGMSVEVARRNTEGTRRVLCVQADVQDMPVRDGAVDWAYSLGVIHHIPDTFGALQRVVTAVRPDGAVLVFVYYALDDRGPGYRALFRAVDATRRIVSRSPRPVTSAFAFTMALLVYWPLARLSALVARFGRESLSRSLPLSFYRELSFRVMRNDSLDRFGTRLEKRFTRQQLVALMERAGLSDIRISPLAPFWHALGTVRGRTE